MRARFYVFLLIFLLLPASALAQGARAVLPEGCESAVLAWLRPLVMDHPVTAGWLLRDVTIDRDRLRLTLSGPAARQIDAVVSEASNGEPGDLLGPVRLACPADVPDVCGALKLALRQQPRAPSPWLLTRPASLGRTEVERAGGQFAAGDRTQAARITLVLVWLALATLLALLAKARWRSVPVGLVPLTLALTVLGLATRLWLAPRGLQHEMFHADESLAFLDGRSQFANGEAVPALVNALNRILHGADATLYTVTLVHAVLAIPALVWFVWRLSGNRHVALLAGVLLALLPNHIHFSASEEFGVVGLTLALISWATWLDWLQSSSRLSLAIAATAGVLAVQTRPEMVLLPLLHATLLLLLRPEALRRWRVLVPTALLAALACWHVPLDMQARGGFPGLSAHAISQLLPRVIWLDPQLAAWPMLAWLALGLATALRLAPRMALWLVVWAAALTLLLLAMYVGGGAYAWRMQLLPAALGCVLMAWSVLAVPRLRHGLFIALALTGLLQLSSARPYIAATALTELQYRFQRQHAASLPADAELLAVLSARVDHPPRLGGLVPGQRRVLHDAADVAHLPPAAANLIYLQSAACWVAWPGETQRPSGLHPACQAVHDRYRLEPIAEMDLPPTYERPLAWAPAPKPSGYRIGFYRTLPR